MTKDEINRLASIPRYTKSNKLDSFASKFEPEEVSEIEIVNSCGDLMPVPRPAIVIVIYNHTDGPPVIGQGKPNQKYHTTRSRIILNLLQAGF